jgi:hypothetical protein
LRRPELQTMLLGGKSTQPRRNHDWERGRTFDRPTKSVVRHMEGLPRIHELQTIHPSVIVAVITVRMVQMAADEVIDMTVMRHALVTAGGSMEVPGVVAVTRVAGRAA